MQGSNSPQLYTVLSGMGIRLWSLDNGNDKVIHVRFPRVIFLGSAVWLGGMGHSN